jgi:hypothetical protein
MNIEMDVYRFINAYAEKKVITKGSEIYKNGEVILLSNDATIKEAQFIIVGTDEYCVTVGYEHCEMGGFSTDCTCPYSSSYSGICKHTVAALFFLSKRMDLQEDVKSSIRNTSKPFNHGNIEKFELRRNKTNSLNNSFVCDVGSFNLERKTIDFIVEDRKHFWNVHTYKVVFANKENELFSTCTCRKNVQSNCVHEKYVLTFVLEYPSMHNFKFLIPSYLEKIKKDVAYDYGMDKDVFDASFNYVFKKDKGFCWEPKDGSRMLSKSELLSSDLLKIENKQDEFLQLFENRNDVVNKDAGVVVYGSFYMNFFPVLAKINIQRTDLVSSFQVIDKSDSSVLFLRPKKGLDELITYQMVLSELTEREYHIDHRQVFEVYEKIFHAIENMKFVYFDMKSVVYGGGYEYSYQNKIRIVRKNIIPIEIQKERIKFKYVLTENASFVELEACLYTDTGLEFAVEENCLYRFCLFIDGNKLFLFSSLLDFKAFQSALESNSYKTVLSNKKEFVQNFVFPLAKEHEIDFSKVKDYKAVPLTPKERNIYLSDVEGFVVFTPEVVYEPNTSFNPMSVFNDYILDSFGNIVENKRDVLYEQEFVDLIKEAQPLWTNDYGNPFFHLPLEMMLEDNWFFRFYEVLDKNQINLLGLANLRFFKYKPHKAVVSSHIESGQDWFDVKIEISFGDEMVKLAEVKKAIKNKKNYVLLSDGTYGILPQEWLDKFTRYFRAGDVSKNSIKISKLKFNIVEELFEGINQEEIIKEIVEKKEKLKRFSEIQKVKVPKGINAKLRDYQLEGVNWLSFLHEYQWGGILADDMGLGKTLQIITFLKQIEKQSKLPNLIVVPTTLIFNWEAEFAKFAPHTKVFYHYGNQREKSVAILKKQNVILTSYGVLVNDVDVFDKIKFNYVVLDESQAIKNPNSLRYKAACVLSAQNRIVCTGTPIENNTFDLYAQCNFLNPGFLGSQSDFKEQFAIPIDKNKDEQVAAELQKIINPFVLRRTKEQVMKELPPKTESILYCKMEEEQMKIYKAYRNKYRDYILKKIDEEGVEKSKMYVLEGLLKLRQICDSPEILSDDEYYGSQSVKIKELLRHVEEKTGKHKILVFSQFVSMLQLVKKSLDTYRIRYEYLDGQCTKKQRQESVSNFQNNKDVRVFLISLKAGGLGLNLTEADYVFIVDPWWNPAVENQAIDRCYRIGQDKKVFAYRMICKDTVEEKIMSYQNTKRLIASSIIQTDESVLKKINKEDILSLFS